MFISGTLLLALCIYKFVLNLLIYCYISFFAGEGSGQAPVVGKIDLDYHFGFT